jgi:hypothetical protein
MLDEHLRRIRQRLASLSRVSIQNFQYCTQYRRLQNRLPVRTWCAARKTFVSIIRSHGALRHENSRAASVPGTCEGRPRLGGLSCPALHLLG